MIVREIFAKTILSKSAIQDYALNACVGCQHNCRSCYARFMKRFAGHAEPGGAIVDVKINAPELLAREVLRKKKWRVRVGGVCDACQDLEAKHRLTCHYADRMYNEQGLQSAMTEDFCQAEGEQLRAAFERVGIPCRML